MGNWGTLDRYKNDGYGKKICIYIGQMVFREREKK
jgi:hypothetical protein